MSTVPPRTPAVWVPALSAVASSPSGLPEGGSSRTLRPCTVTEVRSLGAPELLILFVIAGLLFATFYGAYRAFKNGDTPWFFGILVSWLVGLGWLVGIIYLAAVDGRRRRAS